MILMAYMLENIPPPPKVGEYQPKSFGEVFKGRGSERKRKKEEDKVKLQFKG